MMIFICKTNTMDNKDTESVHIAMDICIVDIIFFYIFTDHIAKLEVTKRSVIH